MEVLRNQRKKEHKALKKLLKGLNKENYSLIIDYRYNGVIYSDSLQQKEIRTTKDWLKRIERVTILKTGIVLNSNRAKKFIKIINKENLKSV